MSLSGMDAIVLAADSKCAPAAFRSAPGGLAPFGSGLSEVSRPASAGVGRNATVLPVLVFLNRTAIRSACTQ
jgi:hypothetical protein